VRPSGHYVRVVDNAEPPDAHADPVLEIIVNLTRDGLVIAAFWAPGT
jgi:hypothetical protein